VQDNGKGLVNSCGALLASRDNDNDSDVKRVFSSMTAG
jgi:hypothetical protein